MTQELEIKRMQTKSSQATTVQAKQQLPETKYFYELAMKRSAEIKTKGDGDAGSREK